MAEQRIWRHGIEEPPPDSWTRVVVPFRTVHGKTFHRDEPEYQNINWMDNAHVWITQQPGEYAWCFGKSQQTGFAGVAYAFSDPQVAFEFRMFWG